MSDLLVQYLREARATEAALTQTLQAHIAATPPGEHRARLEQHLEETRAHGRMLAARIAELDRSGGDPLRQAISLLAAPVGFGLGMARGATRMMLSVVSLPLTILRGPESPAADRVLRNVRAESASEALEVATYTAIERLAEAEGDETTARLAREIREDEERMAAYLQQAVVDVTDRLTGSEAGGRRPEAGGRPPRARDRGPQATNGAPPPPPTPEPAPPTSDLRPPASPEPPEPPEPPAPPEPPEPEHVSEEPELVAEFGDPDDAGAEVEIAEPWEGYDGMRAAEITQRLADSSDEVVAVVELYEQAGKKRQSVLRAAERRLRIGREP
ncbi:MAG TPA: DUF892 family protein [Thermoleophilaceae bacterium]